MSSPHSIETIVDRVAELLNQHIGLRPAPAMRGRLRRSIRDDAAASGLGIAAYFDALTMRGMVLASLCNRVTVQETAFFRHPEHFDVLARDILPGLPRPVTIWSAGCANGQEAYSLAMLLDEYGIDGSVVATDLSTSALERTSAGRYTDRELTGLSPGRIARHLGREANAWQTIPRLRDRVRTVNHNLLDPIPRQAGSCQVVFCRNVLIYFSAEHARAFLDRVADALPAGGALFLGATESVWQASDRFTTVRNGDAFLYRPSRVTRNSSPGSGLPAARHPARQVPTVSHGRPNATTVVDQRRPRAVSTRLAEPAAPASAPPQSGVATLDRAGQRAMAAGDHGAAIVAFRKCAYLAPGDAMSHLNLGLALEAAGDRPAAHRAYAVARRVLLEPGGDAVAIDGSGYTTAELLKFFDYKVSA